MDQTGSETMSPTSQRVAAMEVSFAVSDSLRPYRDRWPVALADLWHGIVRWPLWFTIGWMDVRQRYRRSLLGPFWITLSLGIFVAGLGAVYGALFRVELRTYLPFLATGMVVWNLVSGLISEGCQTFIAAEGAIKQVPVPISVHVYRMVWRNLIVFAHNLLIYLILVPVFEVPLGAVNLLALLGLFLLVLNGAAFGIICGILSARFRDIPLIIANVTQLIFFTTPILWRAETLPFDRAWVVWCNPFFYLIENVREPLLGRMPPLSAWGISIAITLATLGIALLLFARFRSRIAYWL